MRTTTRGNRMLAALRRRMRALRKAGDAHEEGVVFKVSSSAWHTAQHQGSAAYRACHPLAMCAWKGEMWIHGTGVHHEGPQEAACRAGR
jgi:hypothetical protein